VISDSLEKGSEIFRVLSPGLLRLLHRDLIRTKEEIAATLDEILTERNQLALAVLGEAREWKVALEALRKDDIILSCVCGPLKVVENETIILGTKIAGRPIFFSVQCQAVLTENKISANYPSVIYQYERRERQRRKVEGNSAAWVRVECPGTEAAFKGMLSDISAGGASFCVEKDLELQEDMGVRIWFEEAGGKSTPSLGEIRRVDENMIGGRWKKVGVLLLPSERKEGLDVQERGRLFRPKGGLHKKLAYKANRGGSASEQIVRTPLLWIEKSEVIAYSNERNEKISAIVDAVGPRKEATWVVIPPAWGKTKESTAHLAATIVASFQYQRLPVRVIRFDGIRRRGESKNDPECRIPGRENLHFTFSQGVRDILATLNYIETEMGRPGGKTTILVTLSAAAIEGRRAIVVDEKKRIDGWISVVGAPDVQSLIRAVSGGIDYLGGAERGERFGIQEIQGMVLDVDGAARDAIDGEIGFLEDARRDMAEIDIPIRWFCGENDAWIDRRRVEDILSIGRTDNRKLIRLPIGHQLGASESASRAFRMISTEVSEICGRKRGRGVSPSATLLKKRKDDERARLKSELRDVRGFWRRYLLGSKSELGMELIANTNVYRDLMRFQIEKLGLREAERVVDLGAGLGTFFREIIESARADCELQIFAVDYVREALKRSRKGVEEILGQRAIAVTVEYLAGNLDLWNSNAFIPLKKCSFDAALASLVINYLRNPAKVLEGIREALRPGGRLVLSSLRKDADVSAICWNGISDLQSGKASKNLRRFEARLDRSVSEFINSAAQLLEFEESGLFTFWDAEELVNMVAGAGFANISVAEEFGDPPQAYVLWAMK